MEAPTGSADRVILSRRDSASGIVTITTPTRRGGSTAQPTGSDELRCPVAKIPTPNDSAASPASQKAPDFALLQRRLLGGHPHQRRDAQRHEPSPPEARPRASPVATASTASDGALGGGHRWDDADLAAPQRRVLQEQPHGVAQGDRASMRGRRRRGSRVGADGDHNEVRDQPGGASPSHHGQAPVRAAGAGRRRCPPPTPGQRRGLPAGRSSPQRRRTEPTSQMHHALLPESADYPTRSTACRCPAPGRSAPARRTQNVRFLRLQRTRPGELDPPDTPQSGTTLWVRGMCSLCISGMLQCLDPDVRLAPLLRDAGPGCALQKPGTAHIIRNPHRCSTKDYWLELSETAA